MGDALFEAGNYHDAAIVWNRALLHDATDVSELRVMMKRAVALSRMNAPKRLEEICGQLSDRFGDQTVSIGGEDQQVADFATGLVATYIGPQRTTHREQFHPDNVKTWAWSVYWPELEVAGKKTIPISYAANDDFSVVHLGYAAAGFDRRTAKLTWIHEYGEPHEPPSQHVTRRNQLLMFRARGGSFLPTIPATTRTVPAVTKDRFILRMNRTEVSVQNLSSVVWTIRAIGARSGKLLWTTDESLADLQIMADPIVVNGIVFVVCTPKNSNQLSLNALDEVTGKLKWQMPLGSVDIRQAGQAGREVRLSNSGDRLYVFAGGEVVISVNTRQQTINWLYQVKRKQPENINGRPRLIVRGGVAAYSYGAQTKPLSAVVDNLQVFLLDPELNELTCVDEDTRELRWKQESMSGTIVGTDSMKVYVHDRERRTLLAIDRETGKLSWESPVPTSIEEVFGIGDRVFVPYGASLQVLNQTDGARSSVKVIPEAGEIQRFVRDGEYVVAIARDYVTVFSLTE